MPLSRGPRACVAAGIAFGLVTGCGAATSGPAATAADTVAASSDPADTSGDETDEVTGEPPPPTACAEATTRTASPRTVGEAVAFINALPRPLTIECFLERLERPLAVAATSSIVSLQPADGAHSPRLFLFNDSLVLSIAVGGAHGFDLLEFGEHVTPTQSIKAELAFPIIGSVAASAPFERIYNGADGTSCGLCHRGEAGVPNYPRAYASDALRFTELEDVGIADLRGEYERCDPTLQPARCARLTALFAHGPVEQAAFPADLPTIYDYE